MPTGIKNQEADRSGIPVRSAFVLPLSLQRALHSYEAYLLEAQKFCCPKKKASMGFVLTHII